MNENTETLNNKEQENKKESENLNKNTKKEIKDLEKTISNQTSQIENLSKELEEIKTKSAQYLSTASYYKNEAENNKKDFERYKERNKNIEVEAKKTASENVAKKLLPILDNFDQAISQVDAEIMRGFAMIYSSLQNVLSDLGLVEIICKNQALDPNLHNCISTEQTDNPKLDGQIATVYQKGYKFADSDEIVRPATVSVYKNNL